MDNQNTNPQNQLTPDVFKQRVMSAHPEYAQATASDGTPYSSMDSTDFTKRFVQKYPDAVTKDGHKYSDFLPAQPEQPKESTLGKIVKGGVGLLNAVEKPFVGLGALPVQAGVAAYNKITGSNVQDPYSEGVPGLAGTSVPVSKLGVEQKLGDLAQVASYALPGEGVLGAAGMGIAQGAGSAMSEGKDLPTVATQGVLGGTVGLALGGGTKLAGSLLEKAGGLISGKTAKEAVQGIKNAYSDALNLNASQRAFEQRSGNDIANVLMKNRAPLARNTDGTLDASRAIELLQSKLDPLNAKAEKVLTKSTGVVNNVSLNDTLGQVTNRIQKLNISQAEKNTAIQHAKDLISAEAKQYGETVTPDVADKIKQGMWGSSFRGKLTSADKLQGNVSYLTGNTLKDSIEKAVAGSDAGNVLPKINQQRSELIDAIKRLSGMDGVVKLKGGRLGNMTGGIIGAISGAASGHPVGALAGDYFGTKAAEFLQNPTTKLGIAEAKAKAAGLLPKTLGRKVARPFGNAISNVGTAVRKSARGVGLLGNVMTDK